MYNAIVTISYYWITNLSTIIRVSLLLGLVIIDCKRR